MAQAKMNMSVVLVTLLALFCVGALAQLNCMNELISMSPCLEYITGNSSSSSPTSECCKQLGIVVKTKPICLCAVLDDGLSSLGIKVNQTQALALPSACNVQTPPPSKCKSADSPAGTRIATSTNAGSSGGNSIKISLPLLFVVFAATYIICFNFQDILAN